MLRWIPTTAEEIEHRRRVTQRRDWLALLDGEPVGVATCVRFPQRETAGTMLGVLPSARHRGVGGTLYRRASERATELGSRELESFVFADDPDCEGFAERHGFRIVSRACGLRLPIAGCPRPEVPSVDGIRLTTAHETPGLERGIWDVANECWPDIPTDGEVMTPPPFDQFARMRFDAPSYIPEAMFIALAGDEVVGYGHLTWLSRRQGLANHEMLAVRRAWRGRGIAQALKAAQIAWAIDNGLTELRTGNEERNLSARAVNARFPYVPMPDGLMFRGPLAA